MKKFEITKSDNLDIIFEENGEWYFWDETYLYRQGPFPDKKTAIYQLNEYVRELFEAGENI